ncbi:hypothetical protein VTN96DRAFT_2486 [Rasamsonia emersonii]
MPRLLPDLITGDPAPPGGRSAAFPLARVHVTLVRPVGWKEPVETNWEWRRRRGRRCVLGGLGGADLAGDAALLGISSARSDSS